VTVSPRLLSDEQAAEYVDASASYVRALVANGIIRRVELPATNRIGVRARLWRIDVRDLDAWLEGLKV
jgi:excisionase family DNA binding protein